MTTYKIDRNDSECIIHINSTTDGVKTTIYPKQREGSCVNWGYDNKEARTLASILAQEIFYEYGDYELNILVSYVVSQDNSKDFHASDIILNALCCNKGR